MNSNVFLGKFAYTHNGSSEMYGNFLSIKTFLRLRAFLLYTYFIMRAPHGIPVGPVSRGHPAG